MSAYLAHALSSRAMKIEGAAMSLEETAGAGSAGRQCGDLCFPRPRQCHPKGGEFFTPRSVVRTLVEMVEPFKGRVYDPCCSSGGMFVQSEKFIEDHDGRRDAISVYGQEINHTTWRLAKMNLAVQAIDADIRWNNEGSFHRDELRDLRADFILANPPFNISDWGGDRLRDDVRWKFGTPPVRLEFPILSSPRVGPWGPKVRAGGAVARGVPGVPVSR